MEHFPAAPPPPSRWETADPWTPQGPRPTDGFAIALLVTGIVGLGAVPLALGIVALQRIRRSGAAGRGMAVAGVVLGAVSLLAGLVLAAAFAVGAIAGVTEIVRDTGSQGASVDSARVLIDDLAVGDCLDYGDEEDSDAVLDRDCTDAHQAEVVEVVTLPEAGAYPGEESVAEVADARCYDLVGDALDAAGVGTAALDYDYFVPLQQGWDAGNRDVQCLVISQDGDNLTGSLTAGTLDAPAAPTPSV